MGSGFPSLNLLFASPSTNVNAVYGELRKCFSARALTFVDGRLRSCTLPGVECPNSSGAKHRSCSGTKLNAGSRLHYPHRSRGLHPRSKLLRRLLRLILRILIWAFTDAQRRGDLLGLWRLQKVLKVAVLREDIVERLVHHIVGGCVDEGGVLIDLLGGGLVQPNRSTDVAAQVDFK